MSDTNTMSTSARFAQIVSILRKHHIQKGMDPVKFRMILEDLGPTFVKIGQIMSTRQDLFSERYCKELMKLRSQASPMPFSMVPPQAVPAPPQAAPAGARPAAAGRYDTVPVLRNIALLSPVTSLCARPARYARDCLGRANMVNWR